MKTSPPRPRRAALVCNPVKVDRRALEALLAAESRRRGWKRPLVIETTPEDPGQEATRKALAAHADVVLVAGGDGTVRAVAEALAGSDIPLAIIPGGTGNLLARNLALPLGDPEPMVQAALGTNHERIDIGWAELVRENDEYEEHAFVVLAGIGLDAHMIANTSPGLKRQVGWIAYVDGAARALPRAKPFRILYQLDGGRIHAARVQSMLFANCGALPAGIELVPDASLSDGMLDVAIIQPTGPFGWIAVWRKVWWDNSVLRRFRAGRRVLGRRKRDTAVRYLQGARAEAGVATPRPVELDGDEFGAAIRIRCRIDPGALLIARP